MKKLPSALIEERADRYVANGWNLDMARTTAILDFLDNMFAPEEAKATLESSFMDFMKEEYGASFIEATVGKKKKR